MADCTFFVRICMQLMCTRGKNLAASSLPKPLAPCHHPVPRHHRHSSNFSTALNSARSYHHTAFTTSITIVEASHHFLYINTHTYTSAFHQKYSKRPHSSKFYSCASLDFNSRHLFVPTISLHSNVTNPLRYR